jgi:hypothetical protein
VRRRVILVIQLLWQLICPNILRRIIKNVSFCFENVRIIFNSNLLLEYMLLNQDLY